MLVTSVAGHLHLTVLATELSAAREVISQSPENLHEDLGRSATEFTGSGIGVQVCCLVLFPFIRTLSSGQVKGINHSPWN